MSNYEKNILKNLDLSSFFHFIIAVTRDLQGHKKYEIGQEK